MTGKTLFVIGVVFAGIGLVMMFYDRVPYLGKLPADIDVRRGNVRFFFPVTSSVLLSLLASGILWLVSHFKGK